MASGRVISATCPTVTPVKPGGLTPTHDDLRIDRILDPDDGRPEKNDLITGLPNEDVNGKPVSVTLQFDKTGRLHVHAKYVPTGHSLELDLVIDGGYTEV